MVTACIVLLYVSYSIPVICLLYKGRNSIPHGPFWLGKIGLVANCVLLLWTLFTIVMYSFPAVMPVMASSKFIPFFCGTKLTLHRYELRVSCVFRGDTDHSRRLVCTGTTRVQGTRGQKRRGRRGGKACQSRDSAGYAESFGGAPTGQFFQKGQCYDLKG